MIKINNISKTMRGFQVLQDVSMVAKEGMVTGLSGINGSGKTMLMRTMAALVRPNKGTIYFDEKRLWKDIEFPESIGILIENPAFLDSYNGFNNLKMIASIKHKINSHQICETIRKVGLDPDEKKKYRKYSLGMKQRLGLAAALMEKPDVILLDEPTNALDSGGVEILKTLVKEEKKRGATLIITCHDDIILRELADEIYFMEEGRITGHESLNDGGCTQ